MFSPLPIAVRPSGQPTTLLRRPLDDIRDGSPRTYAHSTSLRLYALPRVLYHFYEAFARCQRFLGRQPTFPLDEGAWYTKGSGNTQRIEAFESTQYNASGGNQCHSSVYSGRATVTRRVADTTIRSSVHQSRGYAMGLHGRYGEAAAKEGTSQTRCRKRRWVFLLAPLFLHRIQFSRSSNYPNTTAQSRTTDRPTNGGRIECGTVYLLSGRCSEARPEDDLGAQPVDEEEPTDEDEV